MNKHLVPLLVGAAALVAGCGTAGGTALDATGTPGATTATPEPHPTAAPWPAYDVDDYTFTLRTMCFCFERGVPVVVTVRDGQVTKAVYAHRGYGHDAGDPATRGLVVTINDVIDAANTKHAHQLQVRWPEGQSYPSYVWVDLDANAADEEFGYTIRDVVPA
jgi:hypothetical protein